MFRRNHHHQGAHYLSLLKLHLLKQSIKIHCCGYSGGVAAYIIRSAMKKNIASSTAKIGF